MRILLTLSLFLGGVCLSGGSILASMAVSLDSSVPSPSFLGDAVVWQATVCDLAPSTLWYRFRVRRSSEDFQTVIDYGPGNSFLWTPVEREGRYEVEVSVRNRHTGDEARASAAYEVLQRGDGRTPIVGPTRHPLAFVYSAPACPEGSRMHVEFESARGDRVSTPAQPCATGTGMNFLLVGMRSGAEYSVRHVLETPVSASPGPTLTFTPPLFDVQLNTYRLWASPPAEEARQVLLQATVLSGHAVATDLEGNLLWYYPGELSFLTRVRPGGTMLGIYQEPARDTSYQVVREFDLTGTTLRETNAARVSEQLTAMGKRPITAFHHEAEALPGGRILVLASTEQILTDVQGAGAVNVLGEMILVLDRNLQVEWAWDAFDHLDPTRAALLGEVCGTVGGGCPPFYLTARANDWLHANSVRLTPDGNLLMSIRHLDWVIKIDYANGRGSGSVLWRLGQGGDFTIVSSDPDPWFSHQHDATLLPGPDSQLTLFDNGNARYARNSAARSRGQMYQLDEGNRVATLVYSVDLGVYSPALGSAQSLPNGNFHFNVGWMLQGTASRSVETDAEGRTVYDIEADSSAYRTFRMLNLYTP